MKKPYRFDQVSKDIVCKSPSCHRPLKLNLNLLHKKPGADICYRCLRIVKKGK